MHMTFGGNLLWQGHYRFRFDTALEPEDDDGAWATVAINTAISLDFDSVIRIRIYHHNGGSSDYTGTFKLYYIVEGSGDVYGDNQVTTTNPDVQFIASPYMVSQDDTTGTIVSGGPTVPNVIDNSCQVSENNQTGSEFFVSQSEFETEWCVIIPSTGSILKDDVVSFRVRTGANTRLTAGYNQTPGITMGDVPKPAILDAMGGIVNLDGGIIEI